MKLQNRWRKILNIWLDVPPHVREIGIRRSLMSFPKPSIILWFFYSCQLFCAPAAFWYFCFLIFSLQSGELMFSYGKRKNPGSAHTIFCVFPQLGFKLTIVSWKLQFFWDTSNFPEEKRLNLNYWVFFSFSDGWWEKTWNSCSTLTIDCT